jgi:hypothetical protein
LKNSRHGAWAYRIELPLDSDGRRRPRRRSGFPDSGGAQAELDQIRELLALPDEDDGVSLIRVGDVVAAAISAKRPIPEVDQIRVLLRARVATLVHPTVEQWLSEWLPTKKRIQRNTYRSYESHVRLYLIPYLGMVRLDKLRVAHVADMFDAIVEHNEEIRAARASNDRRRWELVKYQRPVGASSMQRIRETLRAALNAAIREESLTFNAAKWVEMVPADRPKPLLWTVERVENWRRTGRVPGRVMVWTPEQRRITGAERQPPRGGVSINSDTVNAAPMPNPSSAGSTALPPAPASTTRAPASRTMTTAAAIFQSSPMMKSYQNRKNAFTNLILSLPQEVGWHSGSG